MMKERNEILITTEAYTRKQTINCKSIRRPVAINVFINFSTVLSESFSDPSKYVMEILVDSLLKTLVQHLPYSAESAMQI